MFQKSDDKMGGLFIGIFVPLLIIIITGYFITFYSVRNTNNTELSQKTQVKISKQKGLIEERILGLLSDAFYLSDIVGSAYGTAVALPRDGEQRLKQTFISFIANKPVYDHIRFLDRYGVEKIRVNLSRSGTPILESGILQNKGDRRYITEALSLTSGLYISQFDLNEEFGKIEKPHKPVIRFATPVYNENYSKIGLIVLNYKGNRLLEHIRNISKSDKLHYFLANNKGYWLIGPDKESEWAFMFNEKKDKTIKKQYPTFWRLMSRESEGMVKNSDGLFAFSKIDISNAASAFNRGQKVETEEELILVSHIPEESLAPAWWNFFLLMLISATILLLIMAVFVSYYWARRQQGLQSIAMHEQLLSAVQDSANDAIVLIDNEGTVVLWNPAAEKIFGFTKEEMIGKNAHEIITPPYLREEAFTGFSNFSRTNLETSTALASPCFFNNNPIPFFPL